MVDSESPPRLPKCFRVRQDFASQGIAEIATAVRDELKRAELSALIKPGQRVAIAVGSRGISHLALIVKTIVAVTMELGADVVVAPAMGSHGGATAAGQVAMLASLGVDEETIGCPISATMDTVSAGEVPVAEGGVSLPLHFDRVCSEADHVILVNRIKPHTRLVGDLQSGLCKMLMIGLGNHEGAVAYHRAFPAFDYELGKVTQTVVPQILSRMPITMGVAIVEDAFEQTSLVEAVSAGDFLTREPELLKLATERMPRLPFDDAELLIVDRIGKEISGTGLDTNVVGRKASDKSAGPNEWPKIRQIYVRSLSPKSGGNASGIGIAEYCRSEVVRSADMKTTYINCLTSEHVTAAAIPMHFETDAEVLEAAVGQACRPSASQVRWMWIRDTLSLGEVVCSEAYFDEAQSRPGLTIIQPAKAIEFDSLGQLKSVF